MPTSNLHNSTLRGRTETSLRGNYSKFCALFDGDGPGAVGATTISFCYLKIPKYKDTVFFVAGGRIRGEEKLSL